MMRMKYFNRETISYVICGALTTAVGLVVFWLCEGAGLHTATSNTISTIAAVTFAYFANKIVVFQSASWKPSVLVKEILAFISGRFVIYVLETLLLIVLIDVVGLPAFACKVFTNLLVIVGNYLISKKAVFISR